jgi:hypothetical protein
VTPGRNLVIPRLHVSDGLALHQPEWNAVVELLKLRREQLSALDAAISGWNVGLNSGEAAGKTVFHAHWHLIPRREVDCEEPRGEVGYAVQIMGLFCLPQFARLPSNTPARLLSAPTLTDWRLRKFIAKGMVDRVQTANSIIAKGYSHDSLIGGDALSECEREVLMSLCCQHLNVLRKNCGEECSG